MPGGLKTALTKSAKLRVSLKNGFTKGDRQEMIETQAALKNEVMFGEGYASLAVKVWIKENIDHYMLTNERRSQILWSAITTQILTIVMLGCMLHALRVNESSLYTPAVSHSFEHFLVKFPTLIALHLMLSPEVSTGMRIMKFAN